MYMPKKLSFFEKLTGSVKNEEEPEQTLETEQTIVKKNIKKAEPVQEEEAPQESWLPESEGQLTIDVYQTPNDVVIKSTIAGVQPENLDISISNDMITIKGKRDKDENIPQENYYYQECYWGPFSRSIILPVDVESDRAQAGMKNGILTIRLPKIEKVKTRKIKVLKE